MGLKKSVAVAIVMFAVPVVYLTAAVHPLNNSQGMQTQTPAAPGVPVTTAPATPESIQQEPAPVIAPAPGVSQTPTPAAPIRGRIVGGEYRLIRPMAPRSHYALVLPPRPPFAWASPRFQGSRNNIVFNGFDDEQRFVIVTSNSDSFTMSGSGSDARHAMRLKKQITGDFIWFERDDKYYVIRDQATVERAKKLWAPQQELGDKQEELGKQQEVLGKQQEALSAKMEQVRVKVPDMTAELDGLKAKLQKLGASATMEQIGDLQSEIGDLQSKLGDIQSQAGEQQSKVGEEMSALGEKQEKLGEQQEKLGEQQEKLSEQASREMRGLLDEAIQKGTAQPEPQVGGSGTL